MAVVQFGDGDEANISKPVRRMRWATQRIAGPGGLKKRVSILDRFHRRPGSSNEKRRSGVVGTPNGRQSPENGSASDDSDQRRIYFNTPVAPEDLDEDGNLKASYARNKIRTAKYTPLSFVPKNLWFQFHNIANVYFLFIIILSVSLHGLQSLDRSVLMAVVACLDFPDLWCF